MRKVDRRGERIRTLRKRAIARERRRLPGFGPVSEQSQTQPGVFSGFCFPMVLTKILRRREATPFFSSAGRPVGSFFRVARQRRGGVAFSGVRPPQGGADSGFVWHSFPRIQSRQHAQTASRHERLSAVTKGPCHCPMEQASPHAQNYRKRRDSYRSVG
jgi:hypothetical protein